MNEGEKYKIYYNKGNINNMTIEIRAIVDDTYVVFKTHKGAYKMENLSYFEMMEKQGILIKL
jgi:hypothetical protein